MTIVKELERRVGGQWQYRGVAHWVCDDGRWASRVHTGGFDINGEPAPGSSIYIYDKDGHGERVAIDGFGWSTKLLWLVSRAREEK